MNKALTEEKMTSKEIRRKIEKFSELLLGPEIEVFMAEREFTREEYFEEEQSQLTNSYEVQSLGNLSIFDTLDTEAPVQEIEQVEERGEQIEANEELETVSEYETDLEDKQKCIDAAIVESNKIKDVIKQKEKIREDFSKARLGWLKNRMHRKRQGGQRSQAFKSKMEDSDESASELSVYEFQINYHRDTDEETIEEKQEEPDEDEKFVDEILRIKDEEYFEKLRDCDHLVIDGKDSEVKEAILDAIDSFVQLEVQRVEEAKKEKKREAKLGDIYVDLFGHKAPRKRRRQRKDRGGKNRKRKKGSRRDKIKDDLLSTILESKEKLESYGPRSLIPKLNADQNRAWLILVQDFNYFNRQIKTLGVCVDYSRYEIKRMKRDACFEPDADWRKVMKKMYSSFEKRLGNENKKKDLMEELKSTFKKHLLDCRKYKNGFIKYDPDNVYPVLDEKISKVWRLMVKDFNHFKGQMRDLSYKVNKCIRQLNEMRKTKKDEKWKKAHTRATLNLIYWKRLQYGNKNFNSGGMTELTEDFILFRRYLGKTVGGKTIEERWYTFPRWKKLKILESRMPADQRTEKWKILKYYENEVALQKLQQSQG